MAPACTVYGAEQFFFLKCIHTGYLVRLLKAKKGSNPEIIAIKVILISKEAEFFTERHIQNPPQSTSGKNFITIYNLAVEGQKGVKAEKNPYRSNFDIKRSGICY